MDIKNTITGAVGTANTFLTGGATNLAGKATAAAARGGLLGKALGLAAKGLTAFAGLTPLGKAATIAVGAIAASKLTSSHPANSRV
ncbi:MAG: hypothetical protein KC933_05940 [Myxococcales bacterium]|nr:hypothetical protein [Myxococcales bacterium]MCB9651039.1 hypothetical protein [Deltaproteobacteria bacterium]